MKKLEKKNVKETKGIKIKPLGSRVLIEPLVEEENKNSFGIILPDSDKKESYRGIVLAVGDGLVDDGKRVPLQVKVGDKVIFSKYGYEDIKADNKEYYLIKEENILAIIEN